MTSYDPAVLVDAVAEGFKPLYKPEPLTLSEWADSHFYLSAESSYIEGAWETIPYQVAPMNAISNDDIREVDFLKSARVGYTKMIVAAMGYFATHKKRNQVVFQPTDGDAQDFVKDEIDTMLRDVAEVRKNFPWYDTKHKNNTLEKKVLIGSTLNIRGGTSPKNYRRLTVDVVFYDELDAFDMDIGGEGNALTLGDKRAEGSAFKKSIRGSTPKLKDMSLTESAALAADCLFRFSVPCPNCDKEQVLKFGGPNESFGLKWQEGDPTSAAYLCEHCQTLIFNNQLTQMNNAGRWVDSEGVWTRDGLNFYDKFDGQIETPLSVAFHIWTIYSPMTTWAQIVRDFIATKGDATKLKTFVNTTLGETWEDQAEKVDDQGLKTRKETYTVEALPDEILVITAGVDVQDNRLEVTLYGWRQFEESWEIEHRTLPGNPGLPTVWADLDTVLNQQFRQQCGRVLGIAATCVDSGGHFTQDVYNYCHKNSMRRINAIKGQGGTGKAVINSISRPTADRKCDLYMVGVDDAKTLIYSRLKIFEPGPGYVHFSATADDEYFKGLTAEKVVKRFIRGFVKREWVKTRERNEPLDCAVYALAALRLLNPVWPALVKNYEIPADTVEEEEKPDPLEFEKTQRTNKPRRRPARGGYVNKWK